MIAVFKHTPEMVRDFSGKKFVGDMFFISLKEDADMVPSNMASASMTSKRV